MRIRKPVRSSLVSVMQSPDPGLAVAEREIERVRRARFLGAELWSGAGPPAAEELRREAVVAYGAFAAPLMRKPASNREQSTTSAAVT
jgi:hypothetical protein